MWVIVNGFGDIIGCVNSWSLDKIQELLKQHPTWAYKFLIGE